MEKESSKNGIGFMTMLTTMIWGIQIRVQSMPVRFLEGLASILTLEEEEQAEHQQRQVREKKKKKNRKLGLGLGVIWIFDYQYSYIYFFNINSFLFVNAEQILKVRVG